jgi:hypothetical protein
MTTSRSARRQLLAHKPIYAVEYHRDPDQDQRVLPVVATSDQTKGPRSGRSSRCCQPDPCLLGNAIILWVDAEALF